MDFQRVLESLLEAFRLHKTRYAVAGGFAVGALGAPRATMDLDFLVHRDDLEALDKTLTGLGYRKHYASENVSQYMHADAAWGALDFIHAFRPLSLAMLERAIDKPVFGGALTLRVLQAEDVIGLKVQASTNDPKRRARECADIEALLEIYHDTIDRDRLEEYYRLFDRLNEWEELRERFPRS